METVTNDQIMNNTLIFSTLNCEGVKRSTEYIRSYLDNYACDVIALQETWFLDGNATYLRNIHNKYMYTAVSGVDCKARILTGCCCCSPFSPCSFQFGSLASR